MDLIQKAILYAIKKRLKIQSQKKKTNLNTAHFQPINLRQQIGSPYSFKRPIELAYENTLTYHQTIHVYKNPTKKKTFPPTLIMMVLKEQQKIKTKPNSFPTRRT